MRLTAFFISTRFLRVPSVVVTTNLANLAILIYPYTLHYVSLFFNLQSMQRLPLHLSIILISGIGVSMLSPNALLLPIFTLSICWVGDMIVSFVAIIRNHDTFQKLVGTSWWSMINGDGGTLSIEHWALSIIEWVSMKPHLYWLN